MEEPQLVLGRQHSKNALVTAPERAKQVLLALGLGLIYAVTGYVLVVIAIVVIGTIQHRFSSEGVEIEIPDPMEHAWLVLVLYGPAAYFAYRQITRTARRRASRCEFSADKLRVVQAAGRMFGGERIQELQLAEVGSVEMVPPGRIVLVFGPGDGDDDDAVAVDLTATMAEDEFENVEVFFDEHAPGVLRSMVADGDVRYSRRWGWSDVFEWQEPTCRVRYELGDDRGRRGVDTGSHQLEVRPGSVLVGPDGEVALRVLDTRLVDNRGMLLATIERGVFGTRLDSGCGDRLEVQRADSSVHLAGELVGKISTRWAVTTLATDVPLPEPLAVAIVLCWQG